MSIFIKVYKSLVHHGISTTYQRLTIYFYQRLSKKQNKHFDKLIHTRQLEESIKFGEYLIKRYPKYYLFYRKLALCYYRKKQNRLSSEMMQRSLELKLNLPIIKIIEEVYSAVNLPGSITSEYIYLGGHNNYGILRLKQLKGNQVKEYISKICETNATRKELLFYNQILERFPKLQQIVPRIYSVSEISDISFITMEKINGDKPISDEFEKVIEMDFLVTSIKYGEIADLLSDSNFNKKLIYSANKTLSTLESFVSIKNESFNIEIFRVIYRKLSEQAYSEKTFQLFKRLEGIIVDKKMCEHISLEQHYSLQHGDFRKGNMLIDHGNNMFLIDWGRIMIGPTWLGMLGYLWKKSISFEEIFENYLSTSHLKPIEKLFFVYTLILGWFLFMEKEDFERDRKIPNAVEYMDSLGNELRKTISI